MTDMSNADYLKLAESIECGMPEHAAAIRSLVARVRAAEKARDGLFDAIRHGDQEHKDWLHKAIEDHFAGRPVERPRGSGSRERAEKLAAALAESEAANAGLREVLGATLEYERQRAKSAGFSDCTCINYSREAENAYEAGRCPHQIARQALATPSPGPVDALVKAAREFLGHCYGCGGEGFVYPGEPEENYGQAPGSSKRPCPYCGPVRAALQPFLEKRPEVKNG